LKNLETLNGEKNKVLGFHLENIRVNYFISKKSNKITSTETDITV